MRIYSDSLLLGNSLYSDKIAVREISEAEYGVFAIRGIQRGAIVAIQVGEIFFKSAYNTLSLDLQRYPLQIAEECYIGLDDKKSFDVVERINHSCDPNIGILGNNVFVTMRDISVGEEVRYDYAMSDTTDADMGWDCRCGTSICRKKITPRDWEIPELQLRYGIFFSRYILEKIKEK